MYMNNEHAIDNLIKPGKGLRRHPNRGLATALALAAAILRSAEDVIRELTAADLSTKSAAA